MARNQPDPDAALETWQLRLPPEQSTLVQAARAKLRKLLPSANELFYDYAHQLVLCYSPTQNGIDGIVSLAAGKNGTRLYFGKGPQLPDPKRLLQGKAKMVRYVELQAASDLAQADIMALLQAAFALGATSATATHPRPPARPSPKTPRPRSGRTTSRPADRK